MRPRLSFFKKMFVFQFVGHLWLLCRSPLLQNTHITYIKKNQLNTPYTNSSNLNGIPQIQLESQNPPNSKKCQNYQIPLIHPLTPSQIKILERKIILSNAKNIPSIFKLHDWCIWCIWWERFYFMNSFEFAKYPYSIYIHYQKV